MAQKDQFEVEIEKLRDQALVVFDTLVQEAVKQMNVVDDDLKKRLQEEMKKTDKDIAALDKLCRETQNKIDRILQKAVERIEKCWSCKRDVIECMFSEASTIIGVRSGYIEDLIGLAEIKIGGQLKTVREAAAKKDKEVARMVYNYQKNVREEKKNNKN